MVEPTSSSNQNINANQGPTPPPQGDVDAMAAAMAKSSSGQSLEEFAASKQDQMLKSLSEKIASKSDLSAEQISTALESFKTNTQSFTKEMSSMLDGIAGLSPEDKQNVLGSSLDELQNSVSGLIDGSDKKISMEGLKAIMKESLSGKDIDAVKESVKQEIEAFDTEGTVSKEEGLSFQDWLKDLLMKKLLDSMSKAREKMKEIQSEMS